MFTKDEQTEERVEAYVGALKSERAGYVARQDQAKAIGDDSTVSLMTGRIKAVDDELGRFKAKRTSSSKKKDADVEPDEQEETEQS